MIHNAIKILTLIMNIFLLLIMTNNICGSNLDRNNRIGSMVLIFLTLLNTYLITAG